MAIVIDFLLQNFNSFLFIIFVFLLTFCLSIFFKTKLSLSIAVIVVIVVGFFLVNQMQYTTFQKHFSKQLNDDTVVRSISITINDPASDYPVRKARVTIEDEEIMNRILADFSNIRLKKDLQAKHVLNREYTLDILTTNFTKLNYYQTVSLSLYVDQHHINEYQIINEADHLKTIESLIENEEIQWEVFND